MRILVVEDDFASRMYLRNAVVAFGKCDTASNGLEAVKAFQMALEENDPYKLIFLDIMMPFLDGIGALRLIREIENKRALVGENRTSIIMTSALCDTKTMDESFIYGCDSYLSKPIETKLLFDELKKMNYFTGPKVRTI